MSTTIRVNEQTRDRFARLADATGRPMSQLVDEAAQALERRLFFGKLSSSFETLRADPEAWAEVEAERAIEERGTGRPLVVKPRRGDVWLIDFGEPVGREQAGIRRNRS